jgi:NADPH:quinone reductase-like Zn-dependent oxidoreductase
VLIKVHAATVTAGDVNARGFTFVPPGFGPLPRLMFGLRGPRKRILGTELAGEIVDVGKNVTEFSVGDRVFGIDSNVLGAYAEYVCRPAGGPLVTMPAGMSYAEAAATPFGAGTALGFIRGVVRPGQRVLVNGASGGVGVFAVQLARHFGAEVTAVCSGGNASLVLSLGADRIIDYKQEDFAQGGEAYDVIVDTVWGSSYARCRPALKRDGVYLAIAGGPREGLQQVWNALRGGPRVVMGAAKESKAEMAAIRALLEQGVIRPVIDRSFPLAETAAAHRYVDSGRKRGSVIISVGQN